MRITLRLWSTIIALIVAVLLFVWVFLIILLPNVYFDYASSRLAAEEEATELIVHSEFPDSMSDRAKKALEGLSETSGLRIELLDMSGHSLFRCGWGEGWQPIAGQEFEYLAGGSELRKSLYRPGYGDTLVYGKRVETVSGAQAVLTVSMPAAPIDDTLEILSQQMLLVIAASLVISMVMAYYLSRMFVRPIREMDALAASIAQGEFGKKIKVRSRNELGDLAKTINKMSVQLGRTEEMRRDFIATVSHQFKTPLSIIQGHVELIQDTMPPALSQRYDTQFSLILDEIGKLDGMASEVLRLSQVQSTEPKLQNVSLRELFGDLAAKMSVLDSGASLKMVLEDDVAVVADPDLLYHVLENLLRNALKHAKARSIVLSALEAGDGRVLMTVSDDGVGLTQEQIGHIWDKFYKGDPNSTGGSGLGMSIVKEILESHGAEYGIRSNGGTAVWFYLHRA